MRTLVQFVIAWLELFVGFLGLAYGVLLIWSAITPSPISVINALAWQRAVAGVATLCWGGFLMVSGVGIRFRRPWARTLNVNVIPLLTLLVLNLNLTATLFAGTSFGQKLGSPPLTPWDMRLFWYWTHLKFFLWSLIVSIPVSAVCWLVLSLAFRSSPKGNPIKRP